MRIKILTSIGIISVFVFNILADNEKALKYLKLCLDKPASKYLFDHLYDSWNDEESSLEEELKKRLKQAPSPACQRLLVALYEKKGRDGEALDACRTMLEKTPEDAGLLMIKARLEFNGHDYEQCVKDLLAALKDKKLSAKNAVEIKKMLGSAQLRLDREKEALAVWKKLYADNNDLELGEDILQLMLSEGLYEESTVLCQQLIKDCKNKFRSLELTIKLAEIYRLKGARKKALASYRTLLAETGTGSWLEKELFSRIVQLYSAEDDNAGLLKFTADFLKEFPARSAIRLRYIDMLFIAGETDKALAAYLELIKKSPLDQNYRTGYAKMLVKADKYAPAIEIYAGLVKRFPKNSEFLFSKALVEIKADKKTAALKDLDAYLALNDNSEYAYIRAGKLLESAEMEKEAGAFYKKFIEKFSASVDAVETYAVWLLRSKQAAEAVKLLTADNNLPLAVLLRRARLLLTYKQSQEVYNYLLRFEKEYKKDFRYNEELFAVCVVLNKQAEITNLIPALLDTAGNWDELKRAISTACYALSKNDASQKYLQTLTSDQDLSPNMRCLKAVLQARYTGSDKALATLEAAIKNTPHVLMLYRQKAELLNSGGEYVEAAETFKTLLKRDPKARAVVYKQLIGLYERADDQQEALKWAARLKREFPDSAISWMLLARLQEQIGEPAEAIKTLGRAAYRFPENDELRRQMVSAYSRKGDMRGAINICWKILRQSRDPGAKLGMITQIYRLSNTENLKAALQSRLKLQMKNNPKDAFPLLALAEVARLGYKYNEYREYIRKASELGPKSLYLLSKLAEVDEEQGNYAAAESTLSRLCKQDKSGKAELKLADFYFRSGDDEKALEIYQSYLRNHSDLNSLMRFAGDMIVRRRPEEAVAILKDKAVNSNNCVLHYLLGCAYEEADKTDLAVDEFMQVIKLSDTLKVKGKTPLLNNYYVAQGIKLSPALEQLIFIQTMNWQVYQYLQQARNYSRYSLSLSSTTRGVQLPVSSETAVIMAICHLGKMEDKLSPEKQNELIKFLAACDVKYPELALLAANNNFNKNNVDLKKILEKYPDNLDVKLYLCMVCSRQYIQQFGRKEFNRLLLEVARAQPEYSSLLIHHVMQDTSEDKEKLFDLIVDNLLKKDDLTINNIYVLISILGNKQIKLDESRKQMIRNLAIKHFKKLRRENKIPSPHMVYSVIRVLLRSDFIDEARAMIGEELAAEGKNKNLSANAYINPTYRHRTGQGLNFSKLSFPLDPLVKLPGIVNYAMQGYRHDKKLWDNFLKACEGVEDRRIKLIAADGLGDKKTAEKIAAEIASDPKGTLSEYALDAAWYCKESQPEKACQLLLKARKLLKTKDERKELNSRLISYALLIKDKEKVKKYVGEAAEKLLRLNLDVKEKVSLATVLQLAELFEEAEKIESELLKKASAKPLPRSSGSSSGRVDIYQRAEEKFRNKENEQALNLVLREYHYWFRQSYSSFSGRGRSQPNIQLNPHQLRRVCDLVKRYHCEDLMLKKLEPSDAAMQIKKCEYAYACQKLGKEKTAEKIYREVIEKNPKNYFAAFNYAMLLLKENYSAAVPILKTVPLENLILISNNLHNTFTKADQILNFYGLLILKLEQEKNFDLASINNQTYLLTNMLSYLERNKYIQGENKNYPGVFDSLARPEKYKDKFKEFIPRQQEIYLKFCDQLTRIAPIAEDAFCRKLLLFKLLKRDPDNLFEEGLKIIRRVNKSGVHYYSNHQVYYDNANHQMPDFDSYMVISAFKTKRVPELLEAVKETPQSKSLTRQIKDLEKLLQCPAAEFVAKAGKLIDQETDINNRRDLQKLLVAIYQYRKLNSDLTPVMLKELKLYEKDMLQTQDRFAGLQAWIEAAAQRKDTKKLLEVLTSFTDFYIKKYKKEFPEGTSRTDIQSRFHQVIPWMAVNVFRNVAQNILSSNPEIWYPVYKGLKPLLEIDMFVRQLNTYHIFSQCISREPLEFLKNSPFINSLEKIDFCPLMQYDGKQNNLYCMTLEIIQRNSSRGKELKEYFSKLEKPNIGAALFEAALESSSDKVFEVLALPEAKFEQMAPERQKEFCVQLSIALVNKTVSGNFQDSSRAGTIYQLYRKLASGGTRERLEKFYKEDIGNNYWNYSQRAGTLIAETAQNNPDEAIKIFEHALRKLKLFALRNPYNRLSDMQRNMLNQIQNNCRSFETCKVYYECLAKTEKPQLNYINNFYYRLQSVSEQEFNRLKKKDNLTAMKLLFEKMDKVFENSNMPLSYNAFNILHRINSGQLRSLINSREAVKNKSKIAERINTILNIRLESSHGTLKAETVEKMWEQTKGAPEAWRVASGLSILNMSGGEILAPYLAEPILKMALKGDNQAKGHGLRQVIQKLARCKDDALVKKLAPPLINHYLLQLHNNQNIRNTPQLLALVYRTGNQKLIKRLLDNLGMAGYTSTYIVLANRGAGELIKSLLDKNWNKLKFHGSERLSPDGLACAKKICAEIKEPEKKYIAEILFTSSPVYRANKDGGIDYRRYDAQSAAIKKLAEEFGKVKFSRVENKIFCLQALLSVHSDTAKILAEKFPEQMLAFDVFTLAKIKNYNLSRQIGRLYFNCLLAGNEKAVFEKIDRLLEINKNADRSLKDSVKNIMRGCSDAFLSSNLNKIEQKHVKDLSHLLLMLLRDMDDNYKTYPQLAFVIYLDGKQDELIKELKSMPDNRRRVQTYQWSQLRNIKSFCERNKLNARKEITGFLQSPLVKEIFKGKDSDLAKVQTSFVQENCNSFADFKNYYDSLRENDKVSVNMINQFYGKLHQFIRKKYDQLRRDNKNQSFKATQILLKEYDEAFNDSNFTASFDSFWIFNRLSIPQLQDILDKRTAPGNNKSKSALQLDNIIRGYLEIKRSRHVDPGPAEKMWDDLKGLPENWKIALGIALISKQGCENLSRFIAVPVLEMVKKRQLSNFYLSNLLGTLAVVKDKSILKKIAPPLLSAYLEMIGKWSDKSYNSNRNAIAMAASLAYRCGDVETVKKLVADPRITRNASFYICMANAGADGILKETLDKNWRNLNFPSNIVLLPEAAVMTQKISAEFKDAEKKYVVRVLFAGPAVYRKNKDGTVNYYSSRGQRKLLKKLAADFGNIKFSSDQNKVFCLNVLFNRRENRDILVKKSADEILSIPGAEFIRNENYNFWRQLGDFYFSCCCSGKTRAVNEKIKEFISLYKSLGKDSRYRVKNIITFFKNSYNSFNLRGFKTTDAGDFAVLGVMLLTSDTVENQNFPWNAVFFSYLAGDPKTFISAIGKIPANKRNFYTGNWRHCRQNIENFCKKNKLDPEKTIMGLLDSPQIKELCKDNMENINKIKKDMARRFAKKTK
jgi:predicted Zn-dependent protease